MHKSYATYDWAVSRIWMSYHNYKCVVQHVRMSHVPHVNQSCHAYQRVISRIEMMYFPHMNLMSPELAMSHTAKAAGALPCAPHACFHVCATTHSYVCHDSLYVCHDSFIRVPLLIHVYAMCLLNMASRSSKYGNKVKWHHHLCKRFLIMCSEGQRKHHRHMCTPLGLHSLPQPFLLPSPAYQCVCVCYCVFVYAHTLARAPPPAYTPTYRKWVFVVYS